MLGRLFRRFNDVKLRDKILLSFLVLMVAPELILGVLVVGEFRQRTLNEALAQAQAGVDRLEKQTLDLMGVAVRLGDRIAGSRDVESLLTTWYEGPLDVFRAYHDFDMFRLYQAVTPEVTGIQVYADNPSLLDNWEIRPLLPWVTESPWYAAAKGHPNVTGWFSWSDETQAAGTRLSLVRYLPFPAERRPAAVVIHLDGAGLGTQVAQTGLETLVLDSAGRVVAASRTDLVGAPLADPRLVTLAAGSETGTFDRSWNGQRSIVFARNLKPAVAFNGLRVVGIASPAVILQSADRVALLGFGLLAAGSALSLGFLWFVYRVLARRLEQLTRLLPLVGAGDFSAQLPVDGRDEIGQVAVQFNAMVSAVRSLMQEVHDSHEATRRLERAQDAIRLRMLASQINPHFLYNVLESIRMKAHLRGEVEIAGIVKLLGRLMRRNLESQGRPLPLEEELENVRCYLEIERFRLEEKLRYKIDADPDTRIVLVPPLMIEPLVENAVVHGLQPQYGGGTVRVTVRREGDHLAVEVADDGVGVPPEKLGRLLEAASERHVGLANIHQRLQLTFGPEYGLKVESVVGRGTRVNYRIPVTEEEV